MSRLLVLSVGWGGSQGPSCAVTTSMCRVGEGDGVVVGARTLPQHLSHLQAGWWWGGVFSGSAPAPPRAACWN